MAINHCRGWICSELPSWLLFVDGTDAFSGVVVLLCFADFSCQERSKGLHGYISVCPRRAVDFFPKALRKGPSKERVRT